ncbi:MAG: hypothetical protein ACJA0Y_001424 [Maricaulis maris]|jgi:hypothetical protein
MTGRYRSSRRGQPLGLNMPLTGWVAVGLATGVALYKLCNWVLA